MGSTWRGRTSPTSTPPAIRGARLTWPPSRLTAPAAPAVASMWSASARCAIGCSRPGFSRKCRRSTAKSRWPDALSVVEAALGTPGSSIDKSLQNFYDSFGRLAESPVSATVRQDVLLQAGVAGRAFGTWRSRLDSARRDAIGRCASATEEINSLVGADPRVERQHRRVAVTGVVAASARRPGAARAPALGARGHPRAGPRRGRRGRLHRQRPAAGHRQTNYPITTDQHAVRLCRARRQRDGT